jgi:hypothetical protein
VDTKQGSVADGPRQLPLSASIPFFFSHTSKFRYIQAQKNDWWWMAPVCLKFIITSGDHHAFDFPHFHFSPVDIS